MPELLSVGDATTLTTTFSVGGVPGDPTNVTLTVRAPDGTTTTPTPANPSVGLYTASITLDQPGEWIYRFAGEGFITAVHEGVVYAAASLLDPPAGNLTTLAAVKRALGITGDNKDTVLRAAITDASAMIARDYEREFTPSAGITRRFVARGRWVDLAPYDLRTVTSVTLDPDGTATPLVATTGYRAHPQPARDGVITALELVATYPWRDDLGERVITITGDWGFATVPEPVQRACIETVRAITRADPGGWSGVGGEGRPVEPMPQGTYAIPAAAHRWLKPYRLYRGVG